MEKDAYFCIHEHNYLFSPRCSPIDENVLIKHTEQMIQAKTSLLEHNENLETLLIGEKLIL